MHGKVGEVVQAFDDIEAYNRRLLGAHETKASELHYKKGIRISELFEQDRSALYPLPHSRFAVCRYEYLPADGYGKVRVDGEHYYSTRPEYAGRRDILVGIMAHYIDIYDTELVLSLSSVKRDGTLNRLQKELAALDLLILDEWGYVPVDREGAQLLFRVIADSYEQKSLILTTNLEFSKWGGVFTDDQMAAAMIDRLVHHGHLFLFDGKSYRMEHALMGQGQQGT